MKMVAFLALATPSLVFAQTQVVLETNLGEIPMTLYDTQAPQTVSNFLGYVNRGDYDNAVFHRLAAGFVLQGGGFSITDPPEMTLLEAIPQQPPVVNEPGISNTRGTVAMAKLGNDPNSATNQWFINLDDNASNLDAQNGGFTVFGIVTDMTVVDEIVTRPVVGAGGAFDTLPLMEFTSGEPIERQDFITITNVVIVPEPSTTGLLSVLGVLSLMRRRR